MSLFKAIENRKEHRKHYRGYLYHSGWFQSCENHNPKHKQCSWCRDNRLHSNNVRNIQSKSLLKDYLNELNNI